MTETRLRAHAHGPDTRPSYPEVYIIRETRSGPHGKWEHDSHIGYLSWTYDESGLPDGPDYVLLKQGFRRPRDCEWSPIDYGYGDSLVATVVGLPSNPLAD